MTTAGVETSLANVRDKEALSRRLAGLGLCPAAPPPLRLAVFPYCGPCPSPAPS